jgi:two-component system, NarL family, nitrate/nitrite response regulator NarL
MLEEDIKVVGQAAEGRMVVQVMRDTKPDILILDLHMLRLAAPATVQILQQAKNKVKTIVLTTHPDKTEFIAAMKLGCQGIVLKETATELIVNSIRNVFRGEICLDPHTTAAAMRQITSSVMNGLEKSPLTEREREIVGWIAIGYKNREIAEKISISERAMKTHLHNIFTKTGVSDRLELALCAVHNGLHLVN